MTTGGVCVVRFKGRVLKVLLTTTVVLQITNVLITDGTHSVHAEGPADPAPVVNPVGMPNGKKVLFDNTHSQTAGAADWVIDGGFSDFANGLAGRGYSVKELRKTTSITLADLLDAEEEIKNAAEAGIINGKREDTFDPKSASTRAEALQVILNTLNLNPEVKTLLDTMK
jgi:hypothetical protein